MEITRLAKYALCGGSAALLHLAILTSLVELADSRVGLASTIGFLCAIPLNFMLQRRIVFGASHNRGGAFLRYLMVTMAMLAMNNSLLWFMIEVVGAHYLLSQMCAILIIFLANFFLNSHFTFFRRFAPDVGGAS